MIRKLLSQKTENKYHYYVSYMIIQDSKPIGCGNAEVTINFEISTIKDIHNIKTNIEEALKKEAEDYEVCVMSYHLLKEGR